MNIAVILIRYYRLNEAMPRVTTKGQVTIPKDIRDALGIEPGDEIAFEKVDSGYKIAKKESTTADGDDPFTKYRGSTASDETMPARMRRLRGEYPRSTGDKTEDESEMNCPGA